MTATFLELFQVILYLQPFIRKNKRGDTHTHTHAEVMFISASYNLSVEVDNQRENHLAQITKYIIIFFFCNCGLSFTANSI